MELNIEEKIKEYIDKQIENKALASKGYVKSEIAELKRSEIAELKRNEEVLQKQVKKLFSILDVISKNSENDTYNDIKKTDSVKESLEKILNQYFKDISAEIVITINKGVLNEILLTEK